MCFASLNCEKCLSITFYPPGFFIPLAFAFVKSKRGILLWCEMSSVSVSVSVSVSACTQPCEHDIWSSFRLTLMWLGGWEGNQCPYI